MQIWDTCIALHLDFGAMRYFFLLEVCKMANKTRKNVQALTEGAIMVALAQLLGYLKLWHMPWGGSVVLAMVPLVAYCVRWGLSKGLVASFVFGFLQLVLDPDGGFAIGWQSILGDYLFAFGAIGLAGCVKGNKNGVIWGSLIAGVARFVVHYVTGATVWAEYMPESFFGMAMTSPWIYSALYNIAYMGPNIVITMVAFVVLMQTPLKKYLLGQDLK